MENKTKYRIIKNTWFEKGEAGNFYYEVQREKKFLWWNYWRSVTEPSYEGRSVSRFKDLKEATEFIEKIRKGNPSHGWKEEVVWGESPIFEKIK